MPVQPCPQLCPLQMSPDVARCAAGIKIPPGRELPHTESSQPLWRRCNNSHLTYKDTKVLPDVVCAQVHSSGAEGGLCGLQGPGSLPTPAGSFPGHSGAAPKLRSLSNPRTPVSHQAPCPQARGPPRPSSMPVLTLSHSQACTQWRSQSLTLSEKQKLLEGAFVTDLGRALTPPPAPLALPHPVLEGFLPTGRLQAQPPEL